MLINAQKITVKNYEMERIISCKTVRLGFANTRQISKVVYSNHTEQVLIKRFKSTD